MRFRFHRLSTADSDKARSHKEFSNGDKTTKLWCKIGLGISWLVAIGATSYGTKMVYSTETVLGDTIVFLDTITMSPIQIELLPLALNMFVAILCDSMGLIHTCSLRWSLYREGRLVFNTNLRLLTGSRSNRANSWWANALYFVSILTAYVSTPIMFIGENTELEVMLGRASWADKQVDAKVRFNSLGLLTLGVSFLIQAALTTWALVATDIPCWSSNPLIVARVCMEGHGNSKDEEDNKTNDNYYIHRPGRCMMGVHDTELAEAQAIFPRSKQRPLIIAHDRVFWILLFLVALPILCTIWGGITHALISRGGLDAIQGTSWELLRSFILDDPSKTTPTVNLYWTSVFQYRYTPITLGLLTLMQAPITFGLYCAELLVNLSRDEAVYREMDSANGAKAVHGRAKNKTDKSGKSKSAIMAALTAWESVVLFIFKCIIHWMFSLAISTWYYTGVCMFMPQIFYLAMFTAALFLFGLFLAFRRRSGPLPSAFGHIQTIVDIVDEWPYDTFFETQPGSPEDGIASSSSKGSKLFWGHKSFGETPGGPYYAGTSTTHRLPQVYM